MKKIDPRLAVVTAFILMAGLFRLATASDLLVSWANFTPIGAMALFGGCYFEDKRKAYLMPLLTLWLTDVLLNRFFFFHEWVFFYDGFVWVYASFALMVLVGSLIKLPSIKNVILSAVTGAVIHWIISDIGPWMSGTDITTGQPFTQNFQGYIKCLYLALPYMKNLLASNLIFGMVLFGGFEFLQKRFAVLQLQAHQ